jgi:hypothetical protein
MLTAAEACTHTPARSIGFGGGEKLCLISLQLKQEINDVTYPPPHGTEVHVPPTSEVKGVTRSLCRVTRRIVKLEPVA